jgi:hypothetical protein
MDEPFMPSFKGEIKPGESLSTPEWWTAMRALTGEERGFAISVVLAMHKKGWASLSELPDNDGLADAANLTYDEVARLRPLLHKIPTDILLGQLARVKLWPAGLIEDMLG